MKIKNLKNKIDKAEIFLQNVQEELKNSKKLTADEILERNKFLLKVIKTQQKFIKELQNLLKDCKK